MSGASSSDKKSAVKQINLCGKPHTDCKKCGLDEKLMCKYDLKDTIIFVTPFLIAFVPIIIGVLASGLWLWLIAYFGYLVFFFIAWENRILCSHCPYYAEEGKTLQCHANYGLPKMYKYHPEPMSRSEQVQFILGVIIFIAFPITLLLIGGQYLMLFIALIGVGLWLTALLIHACKICINFSCPLNRVPKEIVNEYLKHNDVMREAWERKGYKIDF